jgi:hypothetical protein
MRLYCLRYWSDLTCLFPLLGEEYTPVQLDWQVRLYCADIRFPAVEQNAMGTVQLVCILIEQRGSHYACLGFNFRRQPTAWDSDRWWCEYFWYIPSPVGCCHACFPFKSGLYVQWISMVTTLNQRVQSNLSHHLHAEKKVHFSTLILLNDFCSPLVASLSHEHHATFSVPVKKKVLSTCSQPICPLPRVTFKVDRWLLHTYMSEGEFGVPKVKLRACIKIYFKIHLDVYYVFFMCCYFNRTLVMRHKFQTCKLHMIILEKLCKRGNESDR